MLIECLHRCLYIVCSKETTQLNVRRCCLIADCRDLLRRFLTADPEQRITLQQAMLHPWLCSSKCYRMHAHVSTPTSQATFVHSVLGTHFSQNKLKAPSEYQRVTHTLHTGDMLLQKKTSVDCWSRFFYTKSLSFLWSNQQSDLSENPSQRLTTQ